MVAAVLAIIIAIIGYFTSKKAGATDAQAAMVGVAAGAGAYYVATETEWGKGLVTRIEDWVGLTNPKTGEVITDGSGNPAKAPPGAIPDLNADGSPKIDENGNVLWKLVDESGNVLKSWGPEGTAKVVGVAGLTSAVKDNPWPWVAAAGLAVLIIAR